MIGNAGSEGQGASDILADVANGAFSSDLTPERVYRVRSMPTNFLPMSLESAPCACREGWVQCKGRCGSLDVCLFDETTACC